MVPVSAAKVPMFLHYFKNLPVTNILQNNPHKAQLSKVTQPVSMLLKKMPKDLALGIFFNSMGLSSGEQHNTVTCFRGLGIF